MVNSYHASSMAFPNHTRVLQDLSPNIQGESPALSSKGPVLKVDVSGGASFEDNRECFLTNNAGDHVLRHHRFYQLSGQERLQHTWLRSQADTVPKYKRYRDGQGSKPKGNQDVWDKIREDLFFKGLVKFPPMGRDKRPYPPFEADNETYGRNEHIAFYINDILGEHTAEYLKKSPESNKGKSRKQVSSHLQVLKKMFENRPELIAWMASSDKDKDKDNSDRPKRATSLAERSTRRKAEPYPRPGLRRMHSAAGSYLPEPSAVLPSQWSAAALPVLKPDEFRISLRIEKSKDQAAIHTYTAWQRTRPPAHNLGSFAKSQWTRSFPLLENIIAEVDDDCTLMHAETTLALPDIDMVYHGKELAIEATHFCHDITGLGHGFHVYNQFYNDLAPAAHQTIDCPLITEGSEPLIHVPFFSDHWTRLLMRFATTLKQAGEDSTPGFREPENIRRPRLNRARSTIDGELRRMSAIQRITHSMVNSHGIKTEKTVMVIYWRFRLTKSDAEIGTTTFREFIRPPVSRIMPDIWATNDNSLHGIKHEESSFAIRDENAAYDSTFEMPYHNIKLDDHLAYSFDGPANMQFDLSSYPSPGADIANTFHTRPYEPAMLADLTAPADLSNSDEDGSDFAELTQAASNDVSMFDYSNMPSSLDEHNGLPHLMGPGDGLALGIGLANHLQSFDPTLNNASGMDDNNELAHHAHLAGAGHPSVAFAPHSFPPYPALHSTTTHMGDAFATAQGDLDEQTHFHHYHRVPRLQQSHGHSHLGTPEIHTPIPEDGPMSSGLILAQQWYPHYQQQPQQDQYNQRMTAENLLQHHPQPPRLYRHDTDTTISVEDVDEFERLASQEVIYASAVGAAPQLYELAADDETIVDGDLCQERQDDFAKDHQNMHGLAAVAAATQAGFVEDTDWEVLPAMQHGREERDLDVIGDGDLTETEL